jgi:hypothetical protein
LRWVSGRARTTPATYESDLTRVACELEVVACEGWRRSMRWADTGLEWQDPSPNLRNETQVLLYPGIALLEPTNVSVGRGTDEPFERFGAPWIEPLALARDLGALREAGVLGAGGTPYGLVAVQPVDMFPHTPHVETVAVLRRRRLSNWGSRQKSLVVRSRPPRTPCMPLQAQWRTSKTLLRERHWPPSCLAKPLAPRCLKCFPLVNRGFVT